MRLGHILLGLVVMLLYSCSPVTRDLPAQDSEAGYPLDTKTGIRDVDNILAAVASGDPGRLYALVRYTAAPCTNADGLGGPPKCKAGEKEGTMLEVLPYLGSEGGHLRRDEISSWQGIDATAVYAVYRVSENALNEKYYPPGEYLILFMPDKNGNASALRIDEGGIVRVDTFLGEFPDSTKMVIERDVSEVILPPEKR